MSQPIYRNNETSSGWADDTQMR